ncbi:MAG: penicillin-binding protein 1C [Steroidobacteraceae bacterium]
MNGWSPRWRTVLRRGLFVSGAALLGMAAVLLWLYLPAPVMTFGQVRARYQPSAAELLDRHGEVLDRARIDYGVDRRDWVPLEQISPALITAVVDGEDRRFAQHHGVDWRGTLSALRDDLTARQYRGASTITMQLARLIAARPAARGLAAWPQKLWQARQALSLERSWSKAQILEAYLNLLSYRGELQGIGAAAQRLAGKSPGSLTLPESLVIAALLPQPGADAAQAARRACARAQARQPGMDCTQLLSTAKALLKRETAGNRSAQDDWTDGERLAPQLARALLKQPGERVATTLDARIQRMARDIVRARLMQLADQNVRDGAALVVDNASGEVLAYVASGGPNSRAAQIDGVQAMRQAGSTLKPFLYGMAIERHYLTAASLLDDSPINLDTATGTYIPQDYDKDYKGLVSVRTALASSLNVPTVRTLVLVGVEPFRDRLHALGYAGLVEDGDFYGYSLALGSAEVSLWQQAQAYRALARGGVWSPLTLRPLSESVAASATPGEQREFSAAASFIIGDILSDRAARAVTFGLDSHLATPFWSAAKTGTSKDMRDNWCIGFSQRYTVAVWVGNFEGDSMHEVSGVTGAAPIWHDILVQLQRDASSTEPTPPADVVASPVKFSPAVEPARREWFTSAGATPQVVATQGRGALAHIESPANGMVIALDPDIPPGRQRVAISLQGDLAGKRLLINERTLGEAQALQLWEPKPGRYLLTLQDESGRSLDRVYFTVRGGG